jgi:hypothetical protein
MAVFIDSSAFIAYYNRGTSATEPQGINKELR